MTARACARLSPRCRALGPSRSDELYVCGLLHDIGQLVLVDNLKDDYLALVSIAKARGAPLHEVEEQELALTHAEVGATVAATWGFPASVEASIRFHHLPWAFVGPSSARPCAADRCGSPSSRTAASARRTPIE
jgi:HD-like signal output (HDOD) protein